MKTEFGKAIEQQKIPPKLFAYFKELAEHQPTIEESGKGKNFLHRRFLYHIFYGDGYHSSQEEKAEAMANACRWFQKFLPQFSERHPEVEFKPWLAFSLLFETGESFLDINQKRPIVNHKILPWLKNNAYTPMDPSLFGLSFDLRNPNPKNLEAVIDYIGMEEPKWSHVSTSMTIGWALGAIHVDVYDKDAEFKMIKTKTKELLNALPQHLSYVDILRTTLALTPRGDPESFRFEVTMGIVEELAVYLPDDFFLADRILKAPFIDRGGPSYWAIHVHDQFQPIKERLLLHQKVAGLSTEQPVKKRKVL
jgi:hypothetical protein